MRKILNLTAEQIEKVADIPGLKHQGLGDWVHGNADAISAARLLLSMKPLHVTPDALQWGKQHKVFRDYQRYGVEFIVSRLRKYGGALLADEMGLGKTLQSIEVMRRIADGRTLVCCPAAARETWRSEVEKWGVKGAVVLSPSTSKASKQAWENADRAHVVICSYHHGVLDRAIGAAFKKDVPQLIILDEAHRLRGRFSLRSQMLKVVAPLATYRLALTATPSFDRPRDLWNILHILLPYTFGSRWDFDTRYCNGRINSFGGMDNTGGSNTDELRHRLTFYMLRREKADVAKELPALQRQVRWVDPTPEAKRALAAAMLGIGKASLHNALVATLKGKMQEAVDLAIEAKRFLLVTWLREHAAQLSRMLTEAGTPNLLILGDMPTEKRQRVINEAQAKGVGIVATLDSVSESLNMQGVASTGISHSLDWSPMKEAQKEARLHRLGQMSNVMWYYVAMRESADEVIIRTVTEKLDQWSSIIGRRTGNSEVRKLRHTLGESIDSPEALKLEKEALKAIYKEMQE